MDGILYISGIYFLCGTCSIIAKIPFFLLLVSASPWHECVSLETQVLWLLGEVKQCTWVMASYFSRALESPDHRECSQGAHVDTGLWMRVCGHGVEVSSLCPLQAPDGWEGGWTTQLLSTAWQIRVPCVTQLSVHTASYWAGKSWKFFSGPTLWNRL